MENTHATLRCSSATHQVFVRYQMFQGKKLFIYLNAFFLYIPRCIYAANERMASHTRLNSTRLETFEIIEKALEVSVSITFFIIIVLIRFITFCVGGIYGLDSTSGISLKLPDAIRVRKANARPLGTKRDSERETHARFLSLLHPLHWYRGLDYSSPSPSPSTATASSRLNLSFSSRVAMNETNVRAVIHPQSVIKNLLQNMTHARSRIKSR